MTPVLVFSSIAALALLALLWFLRYERKFTGPPADLAALDWAAFARVLDDSDEPLIRQMLAPKAYKIARRKRIRAAVGYTYRVRANAAKLIGIGEQLRKSTEPGEASEGERLIHIAAQLRTATAAGLWRFHFALVFPSIPLRNQSIVSSWNELRGLGTRLVGATRNRGVDESNLR